jgi:hypothetical protein
LEGSSFLKGSKVAQAVDWDVRRTLELFQIILHAPIDGLGIFDSFDLLHGQADLSDALKHNLTDNNKHVAHVATRRHEAKEPAEFKRD